VAETAKELTKRHYTQLSVDVQTKITGRKCCKIQDRVASKARLVATRHVHYTTATFIPPMRPFHPITHHAKGLLSVQQKSAIPQLYLIRYSCCSCTSLI